MLFLYNQKFLIIPITNVGVSSDRRPNPCKGRQAAAVELYISQESWLFSPSFLSLFHPFIFLLNTSIALLGKHERIAKNRVSKFQLLRFYGILKIAKNGSRMSFFSHFSSPDF